MGVPALFRWLSQKYPKIISPVIEDLPEEFEDENGVKHKRPVDTTRPNPNNEEFDNLYLDMNGIVHPCSHPEDRPPPETEEDMMIAIFEYTERVVNMVRPRKLLMIAVDGVAPRAKMNQQRSRRFRSAQEAAEKDEAKAKYYAELRAKGQAVEETEHENKKTWDSNAITPGTPFMGILAASLRYWCSYKISTDPAWEKMKVIISDATVPGEGEHKIMNFVRSQRSSPNHDPNTRHVIYGLDADLIMLGIATHEPHFRVLREDVFAQDTKPGHCRVCGQPGHMAVNCIGAPAKKDEDKKAEAPLKPFIWLHVSILREYLAVELSIPGQPFRFDLERALDDWVFMCFFVGNDFLPHLPSLDIRENGIDTLIAIWRDNIPHLGGYVTKDGHVDLARAHAILEGLAKQENAIFKRRRETEIRKDAAAKRRAEQQERRQSNKRPRYSGQNDYNNSGHDETVISRGPRGAIRKGEDLAPDINALQTFAPHLAQTRSDPRYLTHQDIVGGNTDVSKANADNKSAAAAMKEKLLQSRKPADNQKAELDALFSNAQGNGDSSASAVLGKRTREVIEEANDDSAATSDPSTPGRNTPNNEIADPVGKGTSGALGGNSKEGENAMPEDTVRLWEDGYEGRYYEQKFHVSPDDHETRHQVARSYVEGLCWVLLYYFQGCPSWTWYYPYHYAPFAADFVEAGMDKMKIDFEKGKPFRPYEQLMGVMPARSNHTIPEIFHPLMTDDDSPIKEFYPEDFEVDLNGKKFAWQGVALLPFIDEKRLLEAMHERYPQLTDDEKKRNGFGEEALIFSTRHTLYDDVATNFYSKKALAGIGEGAPKFKLNAKRSDGLAGKISKNDVYVPNSTLEFPLPTTQDTFTDLDEDGSITVDYHMPPVGSVHKSMLLPGVQFAAPVLDFHDVQTTRDRANKSGRSHGGVQLSQNGDRSDGRRINYGARDQPPHYNGGGGRGGGGGYGGHGYGPNGGYGRDAGYAPSNQPPYSNNFAQDMARRGFPPPPPGMPVPSPMAMPQPAGSQYGYPPHPSQQYNGGQHGQGGYQGGYGGGGGGYDGGHQGGNQGGYRGRRY